MDPSIWCGVADRYTRTLHCRLVPWDFGGDGDLSLSRADNINARMQRFLFAVIKAAVMYKFKKYDCIVLGKTE